MTDTPGDSDFGAGTTYRIHLPVAEQHPERPTVTVDGELAAGSERILVVEDEEGVREFVEEALGGAGYRVRSAASGRHHYLYPRTNKS